MPIDTERYSSTMRGRIVDVERRMLLITRLGGSEQEKDLSEPTNCGGLGRVRHFRRTTSPGWPPNSLPIDPARAALHLDRGDELRAQLFQNAGCNWRCWYCFVPFPLLEGREDLAVWIRPDELVASYLSDQDRADVLVLSGGQPDLVPEWTPWMLRSLAEQGAAETTYVWVDDNLSNDYFWRFLSNDDLDLVARAPNFGRVGCFKGFDPESFAFNTEADPLLFDRQFELFARHLTLGIDCYAYVTLTGPALSAVGTAVPRFLDRLQAIHENLPLRTVPLEIALWGPVPDRLNPARQQSLEVQQRAVAVWNAEMEHRFPAAVRAVPINLVPMRA